VSLRSLEVGGNGSRNSELGRRKIKALGVGLEGLGRKAHPQLTTYDPQHTTHNQPNQPSEAANAPNYQNDHNHLNDLNGHNEQNDLNHQNHLNAHNELDFRYEKIYNPDSTGITADLMRPWQNRSFSNRFRHIRRC
jgi:hypothetical protein